MSGTWGQPPPPVIFVLQPWAWGCQRRRWIRYFLNSLPPSRRAAAWGWLSAVRLWSRMAGSCGQALTTEEVQPFISLCRSRSGSHHLWLPKTFCFLRFRSSTGKSSKMQRFAAVRVPNRRIYASRPISRRSYLLLLTTFTAVTRVQIPSGTPHLLSELPGFPRKLAVQRRYNLVLA